MNSTTNKHIKVSIIIPVFNKGEYLNNCLSKITSQTLRDIEILCIDDGSTDNSLDILLSWEKRDNRISVITQKNSGPSAARNNGIKNSTGDFICFIDADDFYPDDKTIEELYYAAIKHNADICGGELQQYDSKKEKYVKTKEYSFEISGWKRFSEYQMDYGFHRFIYSRFFLEKNQILFPDIWYHEDPVFLVRCLLLSKEFYCIKRCVYCYRIEHKEKNFNRKQIIDFLKGIKILLDLTKDNYGKLHARLTNRLNSSYFYEEIEKFKNTEILNLLNEAFKSINWKFVFNEDPNFTLSKVYLDTIKPQPLISIIVPIYNVDKYLHKCLESIRIQTYKNIEILCIDNLSTDNSAKIIDQFCEIDTRFKHLTETTQGLGSTRNKGIDNAKGYFIYFLDSDDYIAKNTIELLYSRINSEIDFVSHGARNFAETESDIEVANSCQKWFDSFKKPEGKYNLSNNFKKDTPSVAWNKLYHLQKFIKYKLSFLNLTNEDEHFLWAYMIHSTTFYHLNDELYFYRRRSNSIMGKRDSSEKILDRIQIHNEIFSLVKKEKKIIKYRKVIRNNFKSDVKDILRSINPNLKQKALSQIKQFAITHFTTDPTLILFYIKVWIIYG